MGIVPGLKTIGVCIGHPSDSQPISSTTGTRALTPSAVQRNLIDQMARGIRMACDQEDLRLLIYPYSVYQSASPEYFEADGINGLILVSGFVDPRSDIITGSGLPVLLLNRFWDVPRGCGAVFSIEGHTVSMALTHLWELGHRRIAYIAGPGGLSQGQQGKIPSRSFSSANEIMRVMRINASDTAVRRMERFIAWSDAHRIFDPNLVAMTYPWDDRTQMRQLLTSWCNMSDAPTAIFCGHEGAAINLLTATLAQGIRVPQDLSIVGVDTEASLMSHTFPPLTCVEVPAEQMGMEAVRTLLRLIGDDGISPAADFESEFRNPYQVAVPVGRLRESATTAPPRQFKLNVNGRSSWSNPRMLLHS